MRARYPNWHGRTATLLLFCVVPCLLAHGGALASDGPRYAENLRRWEGLTEEQRQAIRDLARRTTPERLEQLRRRLAQFRTLPEEQQERIRTNHRRFRGMRPGRREMLEQRFRRFQALPDSRRQMMRRRFLRGGMAPPPRRLPGGMPGRGPHMGGDSGPMRGPGRKTPRGPGMKGLKPGPKAGGRPGSVELPEKEEVVPRDGPPQDPDVDPKKDNGPARPKDGPGPNPDAISGPGPGASRDVRPRTSPAMGNRERPQGRDNGKIGGMSPNARPRTAGATKQRTPDRNGKRAGAVRPRNGGRSMRK
jgi:hypothetical protein